MTPIFVEVLSSKQNDNLEVCRKMVACLFKEGITQNLPFASSETELTRILDFMQAKGIEPGIVIVNSLWLSNEIVNILDGLAENVPIVVLKRAIYHGSLPFHNAHTMVEIGYGTKTAEEVAQNVSRLLLQFSADKDFSRLETYGCRQQIDQFRGDPSASGRHSKRTA